MNNWQFFSLMICLTWFNGCSDKPDFQMRKVKSSPQKHIAHIYPEISGAYPDSLLLTANRELKNMTDLDYDLQNNLKSDSLYSGFTVLWENDSLISFEFTKQSYLEGQVYTTYYPRVMHKSDLWFYIAPEAIWPDFPREKLLNFMAPELAEGINQNAYKHGSQTLISFALRRDSIIIYPGEEGEFRGKYRIALASKALGL